MNKFFSYWLNLEKSFGSRKATQELDAPSKFKNTLLTNQVTTVFLNSLCTSISYASFSRSNDFSRLKATLFISFPLWVAFSFIIFSNIAQADVADAGTQKKWQFRVFLDDREIGYHRVTLQSDQNLKKVNVEADFKVKLLFFTAFRYQHTAEEVWSDSCLVDIQASTNNNGDKLYLRKNKKSAGFDLTTHAGEQALKGCVRSFAYWDLDLLKTDRLLNTQSGEIETVELMQLGNSLLKFEDKQIPAIRYRLTLKDKSIDLWYSRDMNWLALQSETEGGRLLRYLPQKVAF